MNFSKEDYNDVAKMLRTMPELDLFDRSRKLYISDLLEAAITNMEIVDKYFHSVDPLISKRCKNCGQKLRVKR